MSIRDLKKKVHYPLIIEKHKQLFISLKIKSFGDGLICISIILNETTISLSLKFLSIKVYLILYKALFHWDNHIQTLKNLSKNL